MKNKEERLENKTKAKYMKKDDDNDEEQRRGGEGE